jgi:hypothetical protein
MNPAVLRELGMDDLNIAHFNQAIMEAQGRD